jgi:hypothetical protein
MTFFQYLNDNPVVVIIVSALICFAVVETTKAIRRR